MMNRGVVVVLVLILAGCATVDHTHYTRSNQDFTPGPESGSAEAVDFYDYGESPSRPYEIVGTIYVYRHATTRFQNPSWKNVDSAFANRANRLGADAVIGVKSGKRDWRQGGGFTKWKSGIGVTFVDERPGYEPTPASSIVAVLPVQASDKISDRIQTLAHFELGELGYYGYEAASVDTSVTFEELATWEQERLDEYGGRWADLVLRIEPLNETGVNVGIAADKTKTFRARLFAKSERAVIWTNESAGSAGGIGLAVALTAGREAFRKGFSALFDTLPPVYEE